MRVRVRNNKVEVVAVVVVVEKSFMCNRKDIEWQATVVRERMHHDNDTRHAFALFSHTYTSSHLVFQFGHVVGGISLISDSKRNR